MALDSILSAQVIPPPPKSSVSSNSSSSSASHGSPGASHTSDSSASQPSSSSDSTDPGGKSSDTGTPRNSGKNPSSRSNSSSGGQAQSSSKSSQSQQTNASNQAQSTHAAANVKNGAAQSARNPGPSFLQTLAQSQADAQDSTTASLTAAPQAVTGKGKGKAAKDDSSAANSPASFGFLSQSLVAAMAGIQQQQPSAQGAADGSDSVDSVSLSSTTSAQSLVANLMQNTADQLKAAADDGAKPDAGSANTTPTADASAAAASTFQSHLGVSSQSATQASQQTANTPINTPVGANGFADEVGDKITWMAHQGVQSASLQITPEHMGPVEVKISVQDGSATVAINAAHADTRAALEQALPRLRELFSTQGMNLTDASVSQQFAREQPQKRGISAMGSVGGVSDEGSSAVVSVASARLGLVDTYA